MKGSISRRLLTVSRNASMLIFCDCEQRGPAHEVLHVKVEIVVFGKRIEVCQIHVEEILGTKWTERCHRVLMYDYLNTARGEGEGRAVMLTMSQQPLASSHSRRARETH